MLHHFSVPKRKWPLRIFDAATSLIIYWTDAPAETETEKINSELLKRALYQLLFDPSLWPAAMRWFDSREEDGFVSAECVSSPTVHSIRLLSFFCIHSVFLFVPVCSAHPTHLIRPHPMPWDSIRQYVCADWTYTCRSTWDAFQTLTVWHNFALPVLKSLKKKVNVRKSKRRGNKQGDQLNSDAVAAAPVASLFLKMSAAKYLSIYRWSALVFFVLGCNKINSK